MLGKMFVFNCAGVCVCLLLQLVNGKSLDLQYGYQEIEDNFPRSQTSIEEVKNLEFDQLSDEAIDEICKNFKATIHIRDPESYINCLEPFVDRSPGVILMKREADPLEGSGEPDEPATTVAVEATEKEIVVMRAPEKVENSPEGKAEVQPEGKAEVQPEENQSKTEENEAPASSSSPDNNNAPTEHPVLFQEGFDKILKNTAKEQNSTIEDMKSPPLLLNSAVTKDQIDTNGEEAKTGESQEQPSSAGTNNMLLIVMCCLGVVGALAFAYNFVRSRRESKEIDESIKLEMDGKELKEMKPLMKSPMAQNGSKSLEYIDADPQIQVQETRVEVN